MNWDDRLTKAGGHTTVILLGFIILLSGAGIWEAILLIPLVYLHAYWLICDIEILINTKE